MALLPFGLVCQLLLTFWRKRAPVCAIVGAHMLRSWQCSEHYCSEICSKWSMCAPPIAQTGAHVLRKSPRAEHYPSQPQPTLSPALPISNSSCIYILPASSTLPSQPPIPISTQGSSRPRPIPDSSYASIGNVAQIQCRTQGTPVEGPRTGVCGSGGLNIKNKRRGEGDGGG
jgi:hypothetical protein